MAVAPDVLHADHFDGRVARARRVAVSIQAGQLRIAPLDGEDSPPAFEVPAAQVRWPERTRHGARIARLPDGASLQSTGAAGAAEWDAWVDAHVRRDTLMVKVQQSWRGTLVALALLGATLLALYAWGLPWAARGATAMIPAQVDALIGEQALRTLDARALAPSRLPPAEQQRIRQAFAEAVAAAWGTGAPAWQLEFRSGGKGHGALGANAFALPGGVMVLTDELVGLVANDDAVLGVLGHEFGHVRRRHGMRQLVQVAALGAVGSVAFGDYGTLVSTAPVILASMGYSRDAEREADDDAIHLLVATQRSPRAMVRFFEAIARERGDNGSAGLGIALSSHPADAERIARFEAAAGRR